MHTYNLPGVGGTPLPPAAIVNQYQLASFPAAVRDWHLDRLPRMMVPTVSMVTCPWCGKSKDTRSLQIDHIIPVRTYVRYRAWPHVGTAQCISQAPNPRVELERWCSDHANLTLCCTRCNAGAGDRLLTVQDLRDAALRVPNTPLAARLGILQLDLAAINRLPTNHNGIDIKAWVISGPVWNSSARVTRSRTAVRAVAATPYARGGAATAAALAAAQQAQRAAQAQEVTRDALNAVENLITTNLVGRRLQWLTTADALMPQQHLVQVQNKVLRVCFYCFGLFNKQAFHIDHISPASQLAATVQAYNNPSNLIPVCRTCNTAKGDRRLSAAWLDEQIVDRQGSGLPGVESMPAPAPNGAATWMAYARAERLRVVGF